MPEDPSNATLTDFEPPTDDGETAEDATQGTEDDEDGDEAASDDDVEGTSKDGVEGTAEDSVEGAGADSGDDTDSERDGDSNADSETDDAVPVTDPASVSPAVSTSRFEPDGAACSSCGTSVRRLWLAEDAVVCVDCKPW